MADDALTAAIAEVHAAHAWQAAFGGCSKPCGWQSSEGEDEQDEHAAHVAEQVAQVVREHTAAKQAESLREAADAPIPEGVWNVKRWLRDRAERLHPEPAPDGGDQ